MDKLISERAAIDVIADTIVNGETLGYGLAEEILHDLPSAQPDVPDINVGDMVSRQAVIDAIVAWTVEDRPDAEMPTDLVGRIKALPSAQPDVARDIATIIENEKDMRVILAQPEITDEKAIKHLQSSGWMQNHDKQMYDMGLKEQLADDSGSYDALLPSVQTDHFREVSKMVSFTEKERGMLKTMRTLHNGTYADLLDRLVASAQEDADSAYIEGYTAAESKYRKMWDEMPEIIRCIECKYAHFDRNGMLKHCGTWTDDDGYPLELYKDGDFYCGNAERITDG